MIALVLGFFVASVSADERVVPSSFRHDRIFVVLPRDAGPDSVFFTDTGGGWNALTQATASRLGLATIGSIRDDEDQTDLPLVAFPRSFEASGIPPPLPDPWLKGGLVVAPASAASGGDGLLGSRWFAGRIWRLDYAKQSMTSLTRLDDVSAARRVELGFRKRDDGTRALDFPRMTVTIDGEPIEMLLDTGATATLTTASAAPFGLEAGTRVATSFITRSIFERWTCAHPDWRVIADGDALRGTTFPMIEVPVVTVASTSVGPVWFALRPDANFRRFMSQMTDRPVDGALGGSALRYFRITLDYPKATAYFETATP